MTLCAACSVNRHAVSCMAANECPLDDHAIAWMASNTCPCRPVRTPVRYGPAKRTPVRLTERMSDSAHVIGHLFDCSHVTEHAFDSRSSRRTYVPKWGKNMDAPPYLSGKHFTPPPWVPPWRVLSMSPRALCSPGSVLTARPGLSRAGATARTPSGDLREPGSGGRRSWVRLGSRPSGSAR